jgi:16S rRNA (guanine(966)-N(2))-methyltransferase RsmD
MRTQIRIVAGSLRGRKLTVQVSPTLRPTPQMVREALFSILGDAVPGRTFLDLFAGTGVVGLEALSRGAARAVFVERDFRLLADLERHLTAFGVAGAAAVVRGDVYRWAPRWQAPAEPVVAFLSPPFADFAERGAELLEVVGQLQRRAAPGSVLALQAERGAELDRLPDRARWDERHYGRNYLLFWVKPDPPEPTSEPGASAPEERQGEPGA